jgi:hypothetical protein
VVQITLKKSALEVFYLAIEKRVNAPEICDNRLDTGWPEKIGCTRSTTAAKAS